MDKPEDLLERLLLEHANRRGETLPWLDKTSETVRDLKSDLFDKQIALINDTSRRKAAVCSRRAGKTYSMCAYLIISALENPGHTCLYIALTRRSGKTILWPEMKRMNHKYMLGIRFNNTELIARFPNGSTVMIGGANDAEEIDKYRGNKYPLVVIDEAASIGRHLDELVDEVLEPALIDLNGTLVMIGTPANHCTGKFYDATAYPDSSWATHSWTILDNPHIPHAGDWLEELRRKRIWDVDNPIYQREYMGRWVRSDDSIVFRFSADKNIYDGGLPEDHDWSQVLGVDLGYDPDPFTLVVMHFCDDLPYVYAGETFKETGLNITQQAEVIRDFIERYATKGGFRRIVVDTGGLGKAIAQEFKQRHDLPVLPAEKNKKLDFIELLNDDLRTGKLKLPRNSPIIDEWMNIQWTEDGRKEDPRFPNDLSDAALYAWRECYHWTHEAQLSLPDMLSPEYQNMLADQYWEKELEALDTPGLEWWEEY